MSNEIELKACPACGASGEDNVYEMTVYMNVKQIGCVACGLKGPSGLAREAFDRWQQMPRAQQQPAQTTGLRDAIRLAIAEDDPDNYPAFGPKWRESFPKDQQWVGLNHECIDRVADIAYATAVNQQSLAAQAAAGVDGVAAVQEAWAALQVAVLDGRGWADKIVPMQKAIDALTPAQGGDTLCYTTTVPAAPGWYWRRFQQRSGEVVEIGGSRRIYKDGRWQHIDHNPDTEWAGPIPEPAMLKGGRDDG